MAFVFRSQKKDAPPQENRSEELVLIEETKKERETRQGNVCKGLPFLSKKQGSNNQKENGLPVMDACPIHPGFFNFKNAVFKVKEFNDTKLIKQPEPDQKKKAIMIVKQISTEKLALSMARLESKKSKANNQSVKELSKHKEESPSIVSKNLLKTMLHLSQKAKEKQQSEKIVIDSSKSSEEPKKNRFRDWKSLKKLSPLKDYSKFNITAESDCIDLSCGPLKQPKEEEQPKKRQIKVRVNPRKLESAEEMQDEEEEYITEATPGPGAYSYNLTSKKQFRSKRKKFQKIFYSQIERFQENQKKFQEVTSINDESQPNSKEPISRENSQPFLSKSPKFPQKRQSESPPPGYYDTRQTLEHDLVRHILKSSNSTTFINRSPRVFKVKGDNIPGPGSYALDKSLQKLLQQKNQLSFSYKSQQQRKIDHNDKSKAPAKEVNLMEQGEKVNPIHLKEDSILEDYYYTEPVPFLSSTERFSQLQPTPKLLARSDLKADNVMKASPPRSPFNSSEKRETMGKVGDGIGIGLYNLCKDTWSKKSYNILYQ